MRVLGLNGIIIWLFIFAVVLLYGYVLYVKKSLADGIMWDITFGAPAAYLFYRQIKEERMIKREHSRNT